MIRPFTLICAMLAIGSGLYLYQTKHRAQLLDRQIHQIREATDALREHGRVLRAEYALLNDPQRLAELATAHLPALQPTQPPQWSVMSELEKRLPPIGAPLAPPPPLEPQPPGSTTTPMTILPIAQAMPPTAVRPLPPVTPRPTPPRTFADAAHPQRTQRPAPQVQVAADPPLAQVAIAQVALPRPAPRVIAQPVFTQPVITQPVITQTQLSAPTRYSAGRSTSGRSTSLAYTPVDTYTTPPTSPATTAEAVARIVRGAPMDPSVPMVASALGMARSMVPSSPVSPASAAVMYKMDTQR